ncbi:MAG: hypothetical protein GKR90_01935 [Pseudomonadales bacterium]|nr:hypothetical protein [Pseudomonadales bacterium]
MKITSRTHQGLVRLNNEDCVYYDVDGEFAVLADGMGGLLAGEEASQSATLACRELLEADPEHETDLNQIIQQAHETVCQHARAKNYIGKMGTTLIVWRTTLAQGEFGHVGDSRIYSLAEGNLRQLSKDQTVAQRMVDEGHIAQHEAHLAPKQNVLTQAVGIPGHLDPEVGAAPSEGRLLLCSDGLSDLVSLERIQSALLIEDIDVAAEELVKEALDKGGRDNISVIVIDLDA